jgi:GNAT superfamily N-acetyltransferase
MAPVEIRRLRDTDDPAAVGELVRRAYAAIPGLHDDQEYAAALADVASRRHEVDVVVAVVDGRPVGCLTFVTGPGTHHHEFDDPDAASFRYFGVDPDLQGAGVGGAMVRWCIDEARRLGRRRIRIHTLAAMTSAMRLYERLGFVRTPEFDEVWDDVDGIAYAFEI